MTCINCGKKTEEGKIVCESCMNVDRHIKYLEVHTCGSFVPMEGELEGICQNVLSCAPIKKALKNEPLIVPSLGHVVCPHARINLGFIVYRTFDGKELGRLKRNYSECFE